MGRMHNMVIERSNNYNRLNKQVKQEATIMRKFSILQYKNNNINSLITNDNYSLNNKNKNT